MSFLNAFYGSIFDNGTEVDLGEGINFYAGLKPVYNSATKRVDVKLDDSTFALPPLLTAGSPLELLRINAGGTATEWHALNAADITAAIDDDVDFGAFNISATDIYATNNLYVNGTAQCDALQVNVGVSVNGGLETWRLRLVGNSSPVDIVGGVLSVTTACVAVGAETGTTDTLATISGTTPFTGQVLVLYAAAGDTITVAHGTGNIDCLRGVDMVLAPYDAIWLVYIAGTWFVSSVRQASGNEYFPNDAGIFFEDSGGTAREVFSLNGSNELEVGDANVVNHQLTVGAGEIRTTATAVEPRDSQTSGTATYPWSETHTELLVPYAGAALTISSGAIVPTNNYHAVDTEGAAATDELTDINDASWPSTTAFTLRQVSSARDIAITPGGNIGMQSGAPSLPLVSAGEVAEFCKTYSTSWVCTTVAANGGLHGGYINLGANPSSSAQGVCTSFNTYYSQRNYEDTVNCNLVSVDSSGNQAFGHTGAPKTGALYTTLASPNTFRFYNDGAYRWYITSTAFYPGYDDSFPFGGPSNRLSEIFAAIGTINTSDAREKQDIQPIDDVLLDAFETLEFRTYRWIKAVQEKGEDARWHFGFIAQEIQAALAAAPFNLDGTRCGFLCYDAWDDQYEVDSVAQMAVEEPLGTARHRFARLEERIAAIVAELAELELDDPRRTGLEQRLATFSGQRDSVAADIAQLELDLIAASTPVLVTPAGDRWGVRIDQLQTVMLACQKRRMDRLEARIAMLEGGP